MENIQSCIRIVDPHLAKFFQNGNECFKIGIYDYYIRSLVKVNICENKCSQKGWRCKTNAASYKNLSGISEIKDSSSLPV